MSNPADPTSTEPGSSEVEPESTTDEATEPAEVVKPRRNYQPASDQEIELIARSREYRAHVYQTEMETA